MEEQSTEKKNPASKSSKVLGILSLVFAGTVFLFLPGLVTGIIARVKAVNRGEKFRSILGICLSVLGFGLVGAFTAFYVVSSIGEPNWDENSFFVAGDDASLADPEIDEASFLEAFDTAKSPNVTVTSRFEPFSSDRERFFRRAHYDGNEAVYEEAAPQSDDWKAVGFGLLKNETLYRYRLLEDGTYNTKADPELTGWSYPYASLREGQFDLPNHTKADLASFYETLHYVSSGHYYEGEETFTAGEYASKNCKNTAKYSLYFSHSHLRDLRLVIRYDHDGGGFGYMVAQWLFSDYGEVSLSVPESFRVKP